MKREERGEGRKEGEERATQRERVAFVKQLLAAQDVSQCSAHNQDQHTHACDTQLQQQHSVSGMAMSRK